MCDLLGGVRFCFSCVDPQKWNYSIIGNCECNSVGDGSVFLSSHNHSVPSSSAQDFLFSLLSPALGAVSACKIRSGSSLWGTPTSQRTADPSPATHGMRVSVFWLEPPVPSGSPFFPPLSPKLYKPPPPPRLLFLPSGCRSVFSHFLTLLILDGGSRVYPLLVNLSGCSHQSRSHTVMV